MNVIYSNITGGMLFAGNTYGKMLFSKVSVENYIEYFKSKPIDVLSLSEVHLEDKTTSDMAGSIAEALGMQYHVSAGELTSRILLSCGNSS
jgi:hypothetical protein